PLVAIDEAILVGEIDQDLDELSRLALLHPLDLACPAADIERGPAALGMTARDRVPDVGPRALLLFGQRLQMGIVHEVQPYAAVAGAPAYDRATHISR